MYDDLIKLAKEIVLSGIKETLQSNYIVNQEDKIRKKIERWRVKEKQKSIDLHTVYNPHSYSSDELEYVQNKPILKINLPLPEPDTAKKRNELIQEYHETFKNTLWHSPNGLNVFLDKQLTAFRPEWLLEKFFKRHPWLERDPPSLVYNYLIEQFREALRNLCEKKWQEKLWDTVAPENFLKSAPTWKNIESIEEEIAKKIENAPISNLFNAYYDNPYYIKNYYTLANAVNQKEIPNYSLRRVDLYCHLVKNYSKDSSPTYTDGIAIPKIGVLHHSELKKLFKVQLQKIETLLLNINTEDNPLWIIAQRQHKQWVLYLPAFLNDSPSLDDINNKLSLLSPRIEVVDYQQNTVCNDLGDLQEKVQWQAVLLGRILPWCRLSTKDTLSHYRNTVPLAILLEYALCSSLHLQSSCRESLPKAFINRKPFSNQDLLSLLEKSSTTRYLVKELQTNLQARNILEEFDDVFQLREESNRYTLRMNRTECSVTQLIMALYVLYRHKASKLEFGDVIDDSGSPQQVDLACGLLEYNFSLKSVQPVSSAYPVRLNGCRKEQIMPRALRCAARNRFLEYRLDNERVQSIQETLTQKQNLWPLAGEEIARFFQMQGAVMDLDFILAAHSFTASWQEDYCDAQWQAKSTDDTRATLPGKKSLWPFVQIAQMGESGLDALFSHVQNKYISCWDNVYQESAPCLDAVFDLNGGLSHTPYEYLKCLTKNIEAFMEQCEKEKKQCAPLFQSLSLILPTKSQSSIPEIVRLLRKINRLKQQHNAEADEIRLYNLDIRGLNVEQVLLSLEGLALYKNLQIQIIFPEWDRQAFSNPRLAALKGRYRKLQNTILNNQRYPHHQTLTGNTKSLYLCATGKLDPEVIINERQAQLPQSFAGDDVCYPLVSSTKPQIQQQLQEVVEQSVEVEIEQEQKQEQECEQEQEVLLYAGNENDLVTRENIDALYAEYWAEVDPEIKNQSGWNKRDLASLFSKWVGSSVNAGQVIAKMERTAVEKIMENAAQFRFGIAKDNLPPGFTLESARKDGGLILRFQPKLEKLQLLERNAQSLKKRNPFTVVFHQALPAKNFSGDYRQLAPFGEKQDTLWKFLSTEARDPLKNENAQNCLQQLGANQGIPEDAIIRMQAYDAWQKLRTAPEDIHACREALKSWAVKSLCISQEVADALFDNRSPLAFNEKNLRAFGQIFHHYDHDDLEDDEDKKSGTAHFLFLAQEIYKTFGKEHFAVWKRRIVDASENLSECLSKTEVDAVALSIATLKDKPRIFQNFWWQLVDAHGKSTGHLRYADLWYAFQRFVEFLEDHRLSLNEEAMRAFLETREDFHAQVFLDRFTFMLKTARREVDTETIQQSLLDNVHRIDWRHNALYYAVRYEKFPYWQQALQLTEFNCATPGPASYLPVWDGKLQPEHAFVQSLRFVVYKLRVSPEALTKFECVMRQGFVESGFLKNQPARGVQLIRLILLGLAQGVNCMDDLSIQLIESLKSALTDSSSLEFLVWFNALYQIDGEIIHGSCALRLEHFPLFVKSVTPKEQQYFMMRTTRTSQTIINACGRALQCFTSDVFCKENTNISDDQIPEMLGRMCEVHLYHPLIRPVLRHFPWVYLKVSYYGSLQDDTFDMVHTPTESARQYRILCKQLHSIDFTHTRYLPTLEELKTIAKDLKREPERAAENRRNFIAVQIAKGCTIRFQDAKFRPLQEKEIQQAMVFLEKRLHFNFKAQNLQLCQKLLANHLALLSDLRNPAEQLEDLLKLFIRMDNKAFFNDLGQVLGVLLETAKANGDPGFYSLHQLRSIMEVLIDSQGNDAAHYPANILKQIVHQQIVLNRQTPDPEKHSSLLNSDLNALSEEAYSDWLFITLKGIMRSEIPQQYKPSLVKYALYVNSINDHPALSAAFHALEKLHQNKASLPWMRSLSQLIATLAKPGHDPERVGYTKFKQMMQGFSLSAEEVGLSDLCLIELWNKTQIAQIQRMEEKPSLDFYPLPEQRPYYACIKMIVSQSLENQSFCSEKAKELTERLMPFSTEELQELAIYMSTPPVPNMDYLIKKLRNDPPPAPASLIHHFETVHQASDSNGKSKRHYSVSIEDRDSLQRILKGMRRKGRGFISDKKQKSIVNLLYYANSYAQAEQLHNLTTEQLSKCLHTARQNCNTSDTLPHAKQIKHYESAKMLACMREILLRKTGKWVNHTQMLALIYAAQYNEESILYQMRAGQGKSILTAMRTAYLALSGNVVDLFSSKEYLSYRDYLEFSHILEAMGIPTAYITPYSPVETYKDSISSAGIGAVNYSTVGNFSLFLCTHAWKGNASKLRLQPHKRVAFDDEADHLLKDEKTQFNYSDGNGENVYNFDAWVYHIVYEYYLEKKDDFPVNAAGNISVWRNQHLKALCEGLQAAEKYAPRQSSFFAKFIIPALQNDPERLSERDSQLKHLLTAAHIAHGLQEGVQYSIRPESRVLVNSQELDARIAKVMIDNQIKDGSTYSELVQQFLHTRLNKEFATEGRRPNFFIDPDSQIALSQNAPYIFNKCYEKKEGCTATSGDNQDLHHYDQHYGIKHVIKFPTHEPLRVEYQGIIFADSEEEQVREIARHIKANTHHPILIPCKNDKVLKPLANKVAMALKQDPEYAGLTERLIIDTNDSGKSEKEIVPLTGAAGTVTFSSRMGRGTDIKPNTEDGLFVLRTYPAPPRITKQEQGRGGRNGAKGKCLDVINYAEVEQQYERYSSSAHKERLGEIYQQQARHLADKIHKNEHLHSKKWQWIEAEKDLKRKYLRTRSVQQLLQEIEEPYLRKKEALIASLSGNVIDMLNQEQRAYSSLREEWKAVRKKIETAWQNRLEGKLGDCAETYELFYQQAQKHWKTFCLCYPALNMEFFRTPEEILQDTQANLLNSEEKIKHKLKGHIDALQFQIAQEKKFTETHRPQLEGIKAEVKKILIRHHPDKNKNFDQELVVMATHLLEIVNTCILTAKAGSVSIPKQQREVSRPSAASESLQDFSTLPLVVSTGIKHKEYENNKPEIEFYQTWIQGAAEHYFSSSKITAELLRCFYGNEKEGLTKFYQALFTASTTAVSHIADKDRLFATLKALPHPPSYLVSLSEMAKTLELLRGKFGHEDFGFYLEGLRWFFEAKSLQKNRPEDIVPGDIEKYDALLNLILRIILAHKHDKNNPQFAPGTKKFIANLCQVIRKKHWTEWNQEFADRIAAVMADNNSSSALLSQHSSMGDITHYVALIGQTPSSCISKQRNEQLHSYCKTHFAKLNGDFAGILRPLMELCVSGTQVDEQAIFLPEPNYLKKVSVDTQTAFWNFLTQRRPIEKKALRRLFAIFAEKTNKEKYEKLLKALFNLPPYAGLSFIQRNIESQLSQYNYAEYERALDAITEATRAFNRYMTQKGLYSCADFFQHTANAEHCRVLEAVFERMNPVRSQQFFSTCAAKKYSEIPANLLKDIAEAYASERILSPEQLIAGLQCAKDIHPLPSVWQDCLYADYRVTLQNPESQIRIKDIQCFVNALQSHPLVLGDAQAGQLYRNWKDNKLDQKTLLDCADLLYCARVLPKDTQEKFVERFLGQPQTTPQLIEHYRNFLNLVQPLGYTMFSKKVFAGLFNKYFIQKQCIKKDIQQALKVRENVNALITNKNWGNYFSEIDKCQTERQSMIQYWYHNLIKVERSFHNRCFREYHTLVSNSIRLPETLEHMSTEQRRICLLKNFNALRKLVREVHVIAHHPYTQSAVPAQPSSNNYFFAQNRFFNAQKDIYAQAWWKNSDRKKQAADLFSKLNRVNTYQPNENYYNEVLNILWDTQANILLSDKNTKRNSKGYSRLYDITQVIFLRIARDMLTDTTISFSHKTQVETRLQEQLRDHIALFRNRLPSEHPAHHFLKEPCYGMLGPVPWAPGSTELTRLTEYMAKQDSKNIPAHLRYIFNNLQGYLDLAQVCGVYNPSAVNITPA